MILIPEHSRPKQTECRPTLHSRYASPARSTVSRIRPPPPARASPPSHPSKPSLTERNRPGCPAAGATQDAVSHSRHAHRPAVLLQGIRRGRLPPSAQGRHGAAGPRLLLGAGEAAEALREHRRLHAPGRARPHVPRGDRVHAGHLGLMPPGSWPGRSRRRCRAIVMMTSSRRFPARGRRRVRRTQRAFLDATSSPR